MKPLKKGDFISLLPDFKDVEKEFVYILIEDPNGGRVKVMPYNSGMEIPPVQVVKTEWLVKLNLK